MKVMDISYFFGLITSAAVLGFIEFLIRRKDDKNSHLTQIDKKLDSVDLALKESALDRSRIQLMMLIWHNPKDHRAIMQEAERYFLVLRGDSWMASKFIAWAESEDVDITYIIREHDKITAGKD